MEAIFKSQERNALVRANRNLSSVENEVENRRRQNMREAFERIKGDYETHDALLNMFKESEGFVMRFHYGAYVGDFEEDQFGVARNRSGEEPPYVGFEVNTPQYSKLLLIAQRNRDNHVVLGDWNNVRVRGEGEQSLVNIYVPDTNYQKALQKFGAERFIEPENFALAWLTSKAEVHAENGDIQDVQPNREWDMRRGLRSTNVAYRSKLEGSDLIELYKEGVKQSVKEASDLETRATNLNARERHGFRLFNRNCFPSYDHITRVYDIKLKKMHI